MSRTRSELLLRLFDLKVEADYPAWEEANRGRLAGLPADERMTLHRKEEEARYPAFRDAHAHRSHAELGWLSREVNDALWEFASRVVVGAGEEPTVLTYRDEFGVAPPAYANLVAEHDRLVRVAQARTGSDREELER